MFSVDRSVLSLNLELHAAHVKPDQLGHVSGLRGWLLRSTKTLLVVALTSHSLDGYGSETFGGSDYLLFMVPYVLVFTIYWFSGYSSVKMSNDTLIFSFEPFDINRSF